MLSITLCYNSTNNSFMRYAVVKAHKHNFNNKKDKQICVGFTYLLVHPTGIEPAALRIGISRSNPTELRMQIVVNANII